mgnify:CR=1 FL=1
MKDPNMPDRVKKELEDKLEVKKKEIRKKYQLE